MSCAHGMPTPASCVECMDEGGLPAPPKTKADRWIPARFDSRCDRDPHHGIEVGDPIGFVPTVGWCCARCAT